jgi:hypothetical protein
MVATNIATRTKILNFIVYSFIESRFDMRPDEPGNEVHDFGVSPPDCRGGKESYFYINHSYIL